jgi:hypothetical protein
MSSTGSSLKPQIDQDVGVCFTGTVPDHPNRLLSRWRMRFQETKFGPESGPTRFAPGHADLFRRETVKRVGRNNVVGVESGFATLVVEMGTGGLILWIVMSVAILSSAWRVVKKLKETPWFPIGFVIFWYAFFLLILATYGGMVAYEDFLLHAYFWLFLGLLFRLPTFALSAQFAANAPAIHPKRRWIR